MRLEADEAHEKVEELKGKVKTLEQENLAKEQEITSLNHRNQLLETEVEKLETSVKEAKEAASQSAQHDTQNEALQRRIQVLEEEAEDSDKSLRETNEKYGYLRCFGYHYFIHYSFPDWTRVSRRLRQTDVKAGHYERKVQALESDRDHWVDKFEEMAKKHSDLQKDLQELELSISNI